MTCVIDRISTLHEKKKLARVIGRALQDELNGTVVHDERACPAGVGQKEVRP